MPVKDPKAYYAANREHFKVYHRESYQRNKKQRYANLVERRNKLRSVIISLKSIPCMDCKNIYSHMCMEFDHRNPSLKRLSIATMVAQCYQLEEILKEVEKCDVICSNCHAIRTWKQQHDSL